MPNPLLEAALAYIARGWHVFPLIPGQKEPATKHGFKNATRQADKVRAWWTANPKFNIGIATGPSNLLAVDADVKKGQDGPGTLTALERANGDLPPAPIAQTPSGGFHALYTRPPGAAVSISSGLLGPGLDVRADGGYIVAAPSTLDGAAYSWVHTPDSVPPVEAPEWLVKLATKIKPPKVERKIETDFDRAVEAYSADRIEDWPASNGSCPACEHNGCFGALGDDRWVCFSTDHGSATDGKCGVEGSGCWTGDALDLDAYAQGKSRAEVLREGGYLKDPSEEMLGALERVLMADSQAEFETELARVGAELAAKLGVTAGKKRLLSTPERFDVTRGKPRPPREWVIDGVLKDCFTLVNGHEKSTKTWLACGLAVSIASGKPFAGEFRVGQPGPVVLLLTEDEEDEAAVRIEALIAGLGLNEQERIATWANIHGWYTRRITVTDNEEFVHFLARSTLLRPRLVVMDPLANLHDEEEQSATAMSPVMSRFFYAQQILGCALLLTHHNGKPGENSRNRRAQHNSRGSTVITAVPPGLISYESTDDSEAPFMWKNTVVITARGGAALGRGTFKLEVENFPGSRSAKRAIWSWSRETSAGADLSKVGQHVLEKLELAWRKAREAGGYPAPMSVRKLYSATGHSQNLIKDALEEQLAKQQLVTWQENATNPNKSGWVFVERTVKQDNSAEDLASRWENK